MKTKKVNQAIIIAICTVIASCSIPKYAQKTENNTVPETFFKSEDSLNIADKGWRDYFQDHFLTDLIDTALKNNQEINIISQEIEMARLEAGALKGEYLPSVNIVSGAEVEKVGRYTSKGANDANTEIEPGKEMPEPLGDFIVGLDAKWELDIWHKLRNARKAALSRYMSTTEFRNFAQTKLVSEITSAYYELLALDKELEIVNENILVLKNALAIVKLQKSAAKATELAVRRFEAEVLNKQGLVYEIQQEIVETENKINFLVGRFPQEVQRNVASFDSFAADSLLLGLPTQLLENRPDIKSAEQKLIAAKIDVQVARARFYPSIGLSARLGLQAFNPVYLARLPESLLYSIGADLISPLVNKRAIKAQYGVANAKQVQAIYEYERAILNAFIEVYNNKSLLNNLELSYDYKVKEVDALNESINISNKLFKSARADYMEVLLTQRDALESRFELIEIKVKQLRASVHMYQVLGGGWR